MPLFIAVAATFLQQTLTYMSHLVVPIAAPELSREFGLPIALAGVHLAIIYLFGSICQLFAGGFIQKYGAARMSQVALVSTAIGLMMGAIGELWAYGLGAFIIGAGSAVSTPASSDILARFAPPKHAPLIFSIKQTAVPVGGILVGTLVPFLITGWGWQTMFLALGSSCLVLGILFQCVRRRFDSNRNPSHVICVSQGYHTIMAVLAPPKFRELVFATFTFCGLQGVFGAFFVAYLVEMMGMPLAEAGAIFAIAQAASIVFRITWGWFAGLWGTRPVLATLGISMAFIAILCGFISADWPHWIITGLAVAYSATAISWHGVVLAEVSRLSKLGQTATNTGGLLSFANAGQTTYPALFSVLLAAGGSFSLGFILAGPPALLAGVALLRRGVTSHTTVNDNLK